MQDKKSFICVKRYVDVSVMFVAFMGAAFVAYCVMLDKH